MRKHLIVIHCSATREDITYTEQQLERDHNARGIRSPMGYQFYIRKDGTIIRGRGIRHIGAHVYGHNPESVGICYEGGLDKYGKPKDTRTPEQKAAIIDVINNIMAHFAQAPENNLNTTKLKNLRIVGHRDLSPDVDGDGIIEKWEWLKDCPCFDAEKEYEWMLQP